jgi:hypothetical protein
MNRKKCLKGQAQRERERERERERGPFRGKEAREVRNENISAE